MLIKRKCQTVCSGRLEAELRLAGQLPQQQIIGGIRAQAEAGVGQATQAGTVLRGFGDDGTVV